jgi:enolase
MNGQDEARRISRIEVRSVLDSLAHPIPEVVVTLDDGVSAHGSAPSGETRSRFEGSPTSGDALRDGVGGLGADDAVFQVSGQRAVDASLMQHRDLLGTNGTLGISVAYLEASARSRGVPPYVLLREMAGIDVHAPARVPRLLLNVLNGGAHARTNPVQSDFPEYLLVPVAGEVEDHLDAFDGVISGVRRALDRLPVVVVGGTPVHVAAPRDNRTWIELLLGVLDRLGLGDDFGVMIDASAGDLEWGGRYRFDRTDGSVMDRDELIAYWSKLSADYSLVMIEDPFSEEDPRAWADLHVVTASMLVGDNLTNTDATRIADAGTFGRVDAVLVKPNQAGSVSATVDAVLAARSHGIAPIPSHRSIETDVPWLADVCHAFGVEWAKLGLLSDFATIQKINMLLRYRDEAAGQALA